MGDGRRGSHAARLAGTLLVLTAGLLAAPATAAPPSLSAHPVDGGSHGATIRGLPERIPLLLIHGILSGAATWDDFVRQLAADPVLRAKFKPYVFEYTAQQSRLEGGDPRSIGELGAALGRALAQTPPLGDGPLAVLAHSMGGLVARSFVEASGGGGGMLRITTLGTPHHGIPRADDPIFATPLDVVPEQGLDLAWDGFDGVDASDHVNRWLRCLNDSAATHFADASCADPAEHLRPRLFEKVFAFGAETGGAASDPLLRLGDLFLTAQPPAGHFRDNDGVVPLASALFEGWPVGGRRRVDDCDHFLIVRGLCAVGGRPLYPGALGPLVALGVDASVYAPGAPIALAISARASLAPSDDLVDVFFGSLSDDGTMLWLDAAGGVSAIETPVLRGVAVPDLDRGGPLVLSDTRVGRHAWLVYLVKPGSGIIDYSVAVYTIVPSPGE